MCTNPMIRVSSVGDSKREENKKPTASSDGVIPDGSITKIPVITKGERKIARSMSELAINQ